MDTRDVIRWARWDENLSWEYLPSPNLFPGVLTSELGEAVFNCSCSHWLGFREPLQCFL